jgi:N-acetylglucosamine-6-sulfatase
MVCTVAAVVTMSPVAVPRGVSEGAAAAEEPSRPNIVVILTDDQGTDMLDAMPQTRALVADAGVSFDNALSPTSLCCPARAALLTGTYSHTNDVWANRGALGGWSAFARSESRTLATALSDVGYQTGFFGKYLNGWSRPQKRKVPAGWDAFVAMRGPSGGGGAYYDYSLVGTQPSEAYASEPADYSTDVVAQKAQEFIAAADPADPLFVIYAPFGPHAPFTPAPRHIGAWPKEPLTPPVNEADISDKPEFMQSLLPVAKRKLRKMIRRQHQALISIDEALPNIRAALGERRAADTLFVFLSDNALMNGDHRLLGKYVPYEGATEIPLHMRWDGVIDPASLDSRVITIQDVTATIVDAAGAALPTEGVSYLTDAERTGSVVEGIETTKDGFTRPAYCGWRTKRYLYVRYSDGAGEELYDYDLDPAELDNRADDPAYADVAAALRDTSEKACSPAPPGFVWDARPATP